MPSPHHAVALRLADRFAPELDARVPALTRRALSDEPPEELPLRSPDALAFATYVISVASLAWTVYAGHRQMGEAAKREQALAGKVEVLEADVAFLKGALLADLRLRAPRLRELSEPARARLLDAAAEETLAEAEAETARAKR